MNEDAKKALWNMVNDVMIEVFDTDETPVDIPGVTISPGNGSAEISYSLAHMFVDNDGIWRIKWVKDE